MYAVGYASVTLVVAGANNLVWRPTLLTNTFERTAIAEAVRPYTLPRDPAITPAQAGAAYIALQVKDRRSREFRMRTVENRPDAPWRHWGKLEASLFPTARPSASPGVPNSTKIITATARGLSAAEREVLRQIASAPLWREYDVVARAGGMDVVSAQFEMPFGATENVFSMPIMRFAETNELAYAGVSRAAWHISQGRVDLAESALRGVVSFGFAMIDNAVVPIEQLIGNVIVGIGRDGLSQLFAVTNDPRGAALERAVRDAPRIRPVPGTLANLANVRDPARQRLIAVADDPTVPRAARFQALRDLSFRSCANPAELMAGAGAETRDAFARARKDLARHPGEQAFLDLVENVLTRPVPVYGGDGIAASIAGAASGVSALFANPRLEACTLLARDVGRF